MTNEAPVRANTITGAAVTFAPGADRRGALREQVQELVAGSPYRLDHVRGGPVDGTVTCVFTLREEHLSVGSGNLVELQYRIQRRYEIYGAFRIDAPGVAA